jgi:hypothetical protein
VTEYRIADRLLRIGRETPHLQVFTPQSNLQEPRSVEFLSDLTTVQTTTRASGFVAGRDREVICRFGPDSIVVAVEDLAEFSVTRDGSSIELATGTAPCGDIEQAILGPPLILALRLQNVTVLHAGSVATKNGVVAFLGSSGTGKSTLTAFLNQHVDEWSYCTDDLLPLDPGTDGIDALPHFPQLKLAPENQWCSPKPQRLPLLAVISLGEGPSPGSEVTGSALSAADATAVILKHSAAWTFFPPELTQRQLDFCAQIVETVPVRRIAYPRKAEILPEVADAIQAELDRLT